MMIAINSFIRFTKKAVKKPKRKLYKVSHRSLALLHQVCVRFFMQHIKTTLLMIMILNVPCMITHASK